MRSAGSRFGTLIKWVFVLLVIAVIALAVTPLSLYYKHVSSQVKHIKLTGINGSLVKGSAEEMKYMTMPLGRAEWLLYPKSHKSIGGQLKVAKDFYDLTFNVKKLEKDLLWAESVRGYIDWQFFKQFLNLKYGQLTGYAELNLNNIQYNQNSGLARLDGDVTLKDFKLTQPVLKDLGLVKVVFETQTEGMIVGQFSSDSQVIHVSGALFLHPHRWQLNLDIIPKAGNFELDAIFNSVGQARRGGGRKLNLAGFY
ncbi:type II secretion system protein N [Marinicella litoralis]|uniref:Type II secretion system protein N n=1 Tax=Marinicella litoralis TaxID=644220 RepID=A0A4R6XMA9_9GAMM|nr:type II secretion system protein N [Marinicella litoralis]TDR19499.1 type II secretion system (T2SS) protein N [Marinicella litoralis]